MPGKVAIFDFGCFLCILERMVHLLSDSFAGSFGSAVQLARRGPNCKLQPLIVRIVGLSETVGSENVGLSILVLHGTGIFTYIWA